MTAQRQSYQGTSFWVIKDPLSLKYYRFHDEEYALLKMLDGNCSLEQMRRNFERLYAPQKISLEELTSFIGSLHRSGLVVSDAPGQAEQLLQQRRETTRKKWVGAVTNILSLRINGFDPDGLLTWLDGWVGWLFSKTATLVGLFIALCAALLVTIQFESFSSRLPTFNEFFALENWFWLALALAGTKVLHEFGHGLVCKRFGGECHEMGVMFLVLTPCLYVNVSDSWMLPNKWHRAAIGAAGMYVEVVLASICTFVWWFTEPGLLNYLCLNVMFVSSVSTIVFNANPLLRYDGYYILSDVLEIPNLRSKASELLRRQIFSWCLGIEPTHDPFLPERNQAMFACYTVAAAAYRWVICFSILWFLHQVFQPYGLAVIGKLLAAFAMWGLIVMPLWQFFRFFHVPGRIEKVDTKRAVICTTALIALFAALLCIPLPYYVESPFVVAPRDAAAIYVGVPGQLREIHVVQGQQVATGAKVASLESVDVEIALARVQGQREQLLSRVDDLRRRQFVDPAAAMELAQAEESLRAVETQLAQRRRDQQRLTIASPAAGKVIPPPLRWKQDTRDELDVWHGRPLDARNLGAAFDSGVLVCYVGDPQRLEAVIDIDQGDIDFVANAQPVKFKFDALPNETFQSQVGQIAQLQSEAKPSQKQATTLAGQTLATKYQANAAIDDQEGVLVVGATGTARIRTGNQTVGQRVWRYLNQTFRFHSSSG